MHDDDRELLEPAEGDPPSPEFVEDLWARLDDAWESRDEPTSAGPSPTAIDVAVHDDKDRPMSKQQLWTIFGAVAAIVIVVGGIVVISNRDDEPAAADPPPTPTTDAETADAAIEAPSDDTTPIETQLPPTTTTTTTIPELPSEQPFDITYIEVGRPATVAANEEFAWVNDYDTGLLSTINLETNTVVSTAKVTPSSWAFFAFDSVWLAPLFSPLARFDPSTGELTEFNNVVGRVTWIAAGDDAVWLNHWNSGDTFRIDPATNEVTARIPVGRSGAVKVNDHGVWVRDFEGTVHRIDPATDTVVATIETEGGGIALAAGPDAVWVAGANNGILSRIDPATNEIEAEIDVNAVAGLDTSLVGAHHAAGWVWLNLSYCPGEGDAVDCRRAIARIDPATNEVVAVEDLREGWSGNAMSAGPDTVWTFTDDAIARIDP